MSDPRTQRAALRRLEQTQVGERPRVSYGTANPSGYPNNVPFFRSDLGFAVYFDGTRWLTVHEYAQPIAEYPFGIADSTLYAGAVLANVAWTMIRVDYRAYLMRIVGIIFVNTLQTGANNWTVQFSSNFGATVHGSVNTNGYAASSYNAFAVDFNNITQAAGAFSEIRSAYSAKAGAPGGITVWSSVYYRLVIP